jgi:hypothetical protein
MMIYPDLKPKEELLFILETYLSLTLKLIN